MENRYFRAKREKETSCSAPKKFVLAYSGGLDTSIILKLAATEYAAKWWTFTLISAKAKKL